MVLETIPIPNLVNGVSQQPATVRFPSQCELMDDCYPSTSGLRKRDPSEHVANLSSILAGDIGDAFVHFIDRGPGERYVVTISTSGSPGTTSLKVFDLTTGADQTPAAGSPSNQPDGITYLQTSTPSTSLRAVTLQDVTYLLNTEKTVAMDTATTAVQKSTALLFVKKGAYDTTYEVTGDVAGSKTTSKTNSSDIQTDKIAEDLVTAFGAPAGFTINREGSVIQIEKDSGDFDITVNDSQGNTALVLIKDQVQDFHDLPLVAPDGFVIKVQGDPEDDIDDYYLTFKSQDGVNMGQGEWAETVAPGIEHKLDYATMPMVLIRQSDNTFALKEADGTTHAAAPAGADYTLFKWNERIVGDTLTNPDPAFIGKKLTDIFFHRNRLGVISEDNTDLTEHGELFNFFRVTVSQGLLDSAPISVRPSTAEVTAFLHATPLDRKLFAFSRLAQLSIEGAPLLTPKSVSLDLQSRWEALGDIQPIVFGDRIFFAFDRGGFTGVREYRRSEGTDSYDATDITEHIPKYIVGEGKRFAVSTSERLLTLITKTDKPTVYIYKWLEFGRQKVQSAWGKWTFGSDAEILGMQFVETDLYLIVQRTQGVMIEKITVEEGRQDTDSSFIMALDRRVKDTDSSLVYSSANDETTITLPYQVSAGRTMQVVTRATTSSPAQNGGEQLVVNSQSAGSADVKVKGDQTGRALWIGEKYEMHYRFSEVHQREQTQTGGLASVPTKRTQVLWLTLHHDTTGYYKVEVTPRFGTLSSIEFNGIILGSGQFVLDDVPLETGTLRVPVFVKNDEATIAIKNDTPIPSVLQRADFQAQISPLEGRR